ncbi:MAG: fibronectin/fibrinogen-binding protein [Ruminococcaceae bacterium]|nr:fibronectin/fibrinogen-binding protein [Oscillospiraceae bacterium]
MAFDAGMVYAITHELDKKLGEDNGFNGARIDKVTMPEKDEIHLLLHVGRENLRLVISAGAGNPRIHLSGFAKENPNTPPSFCMLLRKHLSCSRIAHIRQYGFERVAEIEFDFKDEMGYISKKYLIAEIMGKHSNIIFCDEDKKILGAIRTSDFSDPSKRPVFAGVKYELPPPQNKLDPTTLTKETFLEALSNMDATTPADRAITSTVLGVAPLIAREAVFRASQDATATLGSVDIDKLWYHFSSFYENLTSDNIYPCLICRTETPDIPFEFSFVDIRQYGGKAIVKPIDSVSDLIDGFYTKRDKAERIKQRAQDIFRLLLNSQNRLLKKIEAQEAELVDTEKMEYCRKCGDLISQDMYRIKRGDKQVKVIDYSEEGYPEVTVELDERLSPSQNAQRYYKYYNRKKNARGELTAQIEEARNELKYIDAVLDSLSRAETESDLDELREELAVWGYGKRDRKKLKTSDRKKKVKPLKAISPSGLEVYIGKNNLQNDYLTTKFSEKNDWWFHVKNFAGSHVIMKTDGEEPPAEDFTFAASLAAMHSSAEGDNIAVDYTLIKHVKKPPAAKPGFVTYATYWTAYVTPDRAELEKSIIKQ